MYTDVSLNNIYFMKFQHTITPIYILKQSSMGFRNKLSNLKKIRFSMLTWIRVCVCAYVQLRYFPWIIFENLPCCNSLFLFQNPHTKLVPRSNIHGKN